MRGFHSSDFARNCWSWENHLIAWAGSADDVNCSASVSWPSFVGRQALSAPRGTVRAFGLTESESDSRPWGMDGSSASSPRGLDWCPHPPPTLPTCACHLKHRTRGRPCRVVWSRCRSLPGQRRFTGPSPWQCRNLITSARRSLRPSTPSGASTPTPAPLGAERHREKAVTTQVSDMNRATPDARAGSFFSSLLEMPRPMAH